MDPNDLQLITNQKIPDVDQLDLVYKSESLELGAKIIKKISSSVNTDIAENRFWYKYQYSRDINLM
ncbi:hypothetical protein C1646_759380 [Rhizophagus diaphanus]|nr:hypothetical protein C1646_759380 [Rhizophagus diaphanus] [Rhizophagus sp. MUCL 43196]